MSTQEIRPGTHEAAIWQRIDRWEAENVAGRLWDGDPTLWADEDTPEIRDRLGWLRLPETSAEAEEEIVAFAHGVRDDEIRDVVLLGMGGSSLAPEVFQRTLGNAAGFPRLQVLDSTHPAAVRAVEASIELERTLFIVASKSGTTVETLSFFRWFWSRLAERTDRPGHHFVAITDPGTPLVELGRAREFRRVFEAQPDVGGRYSALSHFGLVPAALIGADVPALLERASAMAEASGPTVAAADSPGLVLGAALGELALAGRDKLTFLTSEALTALPDWIEQLIAESTGKDGTGIVPVAHEPPIAPEEYGDDRVFAMIELESDPIDGGLAGHLANAGHPLIRIRIRDGTGLGAEMYRWELATAAAGAVLGIHPFDQPDVQLAKKLAKEAMGGADGEAGAAIPRADELAVTGRLRSWVGPAGPGDYIAIHAYVPPGEAMTATLQSLRARLRDRTRLATTLGYGPRFLHSTGQLHKGGPATGLFLQLVQEPAEALPIPETDDTFSSLIRAQADGDAGALRQRGRRLLRVAVRDEADVTRLAKALER